MKKWLILLIAMLLALMLPAMAEGVAEIVEEPGWAAEAFGGLLEMNVPTLIILIALLAMGVSICTAKKESWTARRMAYAAMCIAIAFVLSCIKLFRMPQGGSVTPAAMLPLILFSLACGPVQGMVVGCAFGLLQMVEDFYVIHPVQVLVDYPMAFAALSLGCLAMLLPKRWERLRLPAAVLLGYFGRYVMAVISGAVFFAEYAGEQNAWIYSLGYNLSYLGIEAVIACLLSFVPGFERILSIMRRKA